jgi:hypothetical protein
VVDGDLTIATGISLTIEAGVVVKFDQYNLLTVNGQLLAEGTPWQKEIRHK